MAFENNSFGNYSMAMADQECGIETVKLMNSTMMNLTVEVDDNAVVPSLELEMPSPWADLILLCFLLFVLMCSCFSNATRAAYRVRFAPDV